MPDDQKVCVVTIHGIGFQQPPHDGIPGYADGLHANMARELGGKLGSDPDRGHGPVYVPSGKPGTRDTEWGLSRVGTWREDGTIDIAHAPLTAGSEPVAHVAVVYNPLECIGPRMGTAVGTLEEAGLLLGHYASAAGAVRLVIGDVWAALHEHAAVPDAAPAPGADGSPDAWLRPRDDVTHGRHAGGRFAAMGLPKPKGGGSFGVVRTFEDDVVAYVCRNDLRQPIRRFVAEVLRRVQARPDVASVIINAHSQGTIVAFDVLREYPVKPASNIRALVTAGSPLRKYVSLFSWGCDAGGIQAMEWLNLWDAKDPVADPLDAPPDWRVGDSPEREADELGMLWATDQGGAQIPVPISDRKVDNLHHSSAAGLQAHNYWGNTAEVIPAICEIVDRVSEPAVLA